MFFFKMLLAVVLPGEHRRTEEGVSRARRGIHMFLRFSREGSRGMFRYDDLQNGALFCSFQMFQSLKTSRRII